MSQSDSTDFYAHLPLIEHFFDASGSHNYHSLPSDWYIAATDVVDSTTAIGNGQYKSVNILGASPIVGILNATDRNKIPFSFGGDGCIFCIPPGFYEDAQNVLIASRRIGKSAYDLMLRTALIPVSHIRTQGYDIKVARYRVSEFYDQAIFSGGGVSYTEELLKSAEIERFCVSTENKNATADFSGLECRWQEVHQKNKDVLTLLMKATTTGKQAEKTYQEVLQKMRDIFGFDDQTNPIEPSQLSMNISISNLVGEVKFRTSGNGIWNRLLYFLKIQVQTILGKIFMALGYKSSATNWSLYKPDLALNSDHRKFDDMLRVVISGTAQQRKQLQNFLEQKYRQQKLAYGIHVTDAAIITCMVFKYHREHVHFVDGKDGGYVSASKGLKARLKMLNKK